MAAQRLFIGQAAANTRYEAAPLASAALAAVGEPSVDASEEGSTAVVSLHQKHVAVSR